MRTFDGLADADAIAQELASVEPGDALEAVQLADAMAWVRSGAPLCRTARPATPAKHLVAYFAVVDRAQRELLLVDHRNAGLWLPTGGHVEPGEHPRLTAAREAAEELGLQVDPARVGPPRFITVTETVGRSAGHVDVSLWYVLRVPRDALLRPDPAEFHEARWFALDALPATRVEAHLQRFAAKLRAASAEATVREACAADAEPIAALLPDLGYVATPEQVARRLDALQSWPDQKVFVAEQGGRLLGLCHVQGVRLLASDGYAELQALVVAADRQGQGWGRRLLEQAQRWAGQAGYARLRLRSGTQRDAAHRFYRGQGFAQGRASYAFERATIPASPRPPKD